ncbi:hypothetical protein DFH08DRAFT_1086580 [Mycena albidolilacea]|uniref:Uncharacterized protein n=1 Tax=Mycena albidolilacea TaxID=1033008 RepID=A0AAD6ZD64_9AGAR|nr:hypothetical protein DFH08DRAFT_1086580 [Mycena albidolilacea]
MSCSGSLPFRLTLAVDEGFKVHFVVIVFHQTFEGLGLGSRLAFIKLPTSYNYVPVLAAIIYGLSTPVGIAATRGTRAAQLVQPRQRNRVNRLRLSRFAERGPTVS